MHQPLRGVNPSLVAIPGHVVAAHGHLADQVVGKVHLQEGVVEILSDVRVLLVVKQAAKASQPLGPLPAEPENLVDIVYRHIREEAGAIVPVGRRHWVFEDRDDLERCADSASVQQGFGPQQRGVEAAHKSLHQGRAAKGVGV